MQMCARTIFQGEKSKLKKQVVDKRAGIESIRKEKVKEKERSNFHFRDKVIPRRIWGKREVSMFYQDSCEWVLDVRDIVGKVAFFPLQHLSETTPAIKLSPTALHLHVIVCSEE